MLGLKLNLTNYADSSWFTILTFYGKKKGQFHGEEA